MNFDGEFPGGESFWSEGRGKGLDEEVFLKILEHISQKAKIINYTMLNALMNNTNFKTRAQLDREASWRRMDDIR